MAKPNVTVIGSVNFDETVYVTQFNAPGQSQTALDKRYGIGGKGFNQALAAFRFACDGERAKPDINVQMIGAVGKDKMGEDAIRTLKQNGIITRLRETSNCETGRAFITVDSHGESEVILTPGANHTLIPEYFLTLEDIGGGPDRKPDLLVLQLEIPIPVVERVLRTAAQHHVDVLLNPAPTNMILRNIWQTIKHFVANEDEAVVMSGLDSSSLQDESFNRRWRMVANELHIRGPVYVVITLGKDGVFFSQGKDRGEYLEAQKVRVADTTSAGDAFIGAYAAEVVQMGDKFDMRKAVKSALLVAEYAVQRKGAQVSIPWRGELSELADP